MVNVCTNGTTMNKIKSKLKAIKNKYGIALPIAEALTLSTIGGGLLQKGGYLDNNEDSTEISYGKLHREMTPQEKSDAILMSSIIMTEGCSLDAYQDDVGIWTYGAGCTKTKEGKSVKAGDKLKSNEEAFDVANHHIKERIDYVFDYIRRELTPEQKAGLKSFAYNCGAGTLVKDGELTKLGKAVNEGNDDFVIREMLTYNKAGGRFMKGLFFRRVLEAYIYQGFIPIEELQKCIIGGIYNVSYNQEMKDIFGLKELRIRGRGRRAKTKATYIDSAITNPEVAKKMVDICQIPVQGKVSDKYAKFHMGEEIAEFLPKCFRANTLKLDENILADMNREISQGVDVINIKDKTQVASVGPDIGLFLRTLKSIRGK